jgi:hypothetical protein
MRSMKMNVSCVRSELESKGAVYSMRAYVYSGSVWIEGFGECSALTVAKARDHGAWQDQVIEKFVNESGFGDIGSWKSMAEKLNGGGDLWILKVTRGVKR